MFIDERTLKDRITKPSLGSYALKSKADVIKQPYGSYDLFFEMTFKAIPKLGKYEDIGSLKECRKATEKQIVKPPIVEYQIAAVSYWRYRCPSCKLTLETISDNQTLTGKPTGKLVKIPRKYRNGCNTYCNRCGQKIDWSDLYE